jgi:hypothetical protein
LGDIDVTAREAVESSEAGIHVHAMLQAVKSAPKPYKEFKTYRIENLAQSFELRFCPLFLSDQFLQRQLLLGHAIRIATGSRARRDRRSMYIVHV